MCHLLLNSNLLIFLLFSLYLLYNHFNDLITKIYKLHPLLFSSIYIVFIAIEQRVQVFHYQRISIFSTYCAIPHHCTQQGFQLEFAYCFKGPQCTLYQVQLFFKRLSGIARDEARYVHTYFSPVSEKEKERMFSQFSLLFLTCCGRFLHTYFFFFTLLY